MSLLDLGAELRSGDLLLFSGESLFSHSIRAATNSRWSHCGMVVRDKSGIAQLWDVSKKTYGGTVGLYDLQGRVAKYQGAIAYRALHKSDGTRGFDDALKEAFIEVHDRLLGRPYEMKKIELLKAAFDPKIFSYELAINDPDLSSIFCGELVAETYQHLGLLDRTIPANEYVPADFGDAKPLLLYKDYRLSAEVIIKEPLD